MKVLKIITCIFFLFLLLPVNYIYGADNDTTEIILLFKDVRKKYSTDKDLSEKDSIKLETALKLSRQINYLAGEAQYYDIRGVHERNVSNYMKAIEFHHKAFQIIENTGHLKEQAIILNNIGVVYRRLDDLDRAADYHLRALAIAEKINEKPSVSVSLNSLGNIFLAEKKYDKALDFFTNALNREIEAKNYLGIAINYNNIGSVYENKQEYTKAIEYYTKSLEANVKIGSTKGMGICFLSLGEVYLQQDNLIEANKFLNKALDLNEKLSDRIYTSSTLIALGQFNLKSKKFSKAHYFFNKGLSISLAINSKKYIREAYSGLSETFENTGQSDSALYFFKLATQYQDSILNDENTKDLNLKQVLYETGKKDKEIELLIYKQQIKDKKQKLITGILVSGCIVLLLLVILIYNSYRLKRIANGNLEKYNIDIEEKNKILTQQKEEILSQNDEIENKSNLLQQAYETIKIKNNNITDNIHYAVQIQNAMLPEPKFIQQLLPESFIFYQPKDLVSGDFYWVAKSNNKTVLAIADCTGHGVTGAFMSILGITMLNEIVQEKGITDANLVLNALREKLIDILQQGNTFSESREGIHMVICTFDEKFRNMQFSGAINSIYLIRENQVLQYKGDKMPVSIAPEMEPFSLVEIPLEPKDMVYLYSDGYYGQFGGLDDKKFNIFRFRNLLQKISHLTLSEQHIIIERTYNAWKGMAEQVDDILVMGIRITN